MQNKQLTLNKNNILIIGNGSIGVSDNGKSYIDKHTGMFLNKINENNFNPVFCQFSTNITKDPNPNDFDLEKNKIRYISIAQKKTITSKIFELVRVLFITIRFRNIYLFFPGSLSMVFGLISIILNRKIGIYVRGQKYGENWVSKIILRRASFILTVSPTLMTDLKKFNPNIQLIKPMVDIYKEDFIPIKRNGRMGSIKLLFVGRVEERKGIYELIKICDQLEKNEVNFIMDIIGGGELVEHFKILQKNNLINKRINLKGIVENKKELSDYYRSADILIFPSHDEGFPRVLYEAMSKALPIITTMVGGIPGYMKNDVNCIEIPVKNSEKASEIILQIINNEQKRISIGSNGYSTAYEIFNGKFKEHDILLSEEMKKTLIK